MPGTLKTICSTVVALAFIVVLLVIFKGCEAQTTVRCPNGIEVQVEVGSGYETDLLESGSEVTQFCEVNQQGGR